ncbi:MAG: hypothetical protein AB1333_04490 [Patescibacteria group bacterium]
MERLKRKTARFFKKVRLFCISLQREEGEKDEGIDKMKIFATAYTGINPRFH